MWAEDSPDDGRTHEMHDGRRRARTVARTMAVALLAALMVLPLAGCGTKTASTTTTSTKAVAGFPITITDDASRTVTIESKPKRVVSLAPANTEIMYSLGLIDEVVGVTTYDDYPKQVKNIAKVGDFTTPNLEAIAAAKPDLVLVASGVQSDVLSKLESLGAKVLVIDPQTLDGVYKSIKKVADATGTSKKGDQLIADMSVEVGDIQLRVSNADPVTTFVEVGYNPLYTAGSGTLLNDLITQAGGKNVVTQAGYVGYSVEQLVKAQPAVYLGTKSSIGDTSTVAKRAGYSALSAVKSGRVVALTDDLVSRGGPRIIEGIREIAKALHPDLFK
jgi:iron complex transport system substrate-binding protein